MTNRRFRLFALTILGASLTQICCAPPATSAPQQTALPIKDFGRGTKAVTPLGPNPAPWVDFSGTWETVTGQGNTFTMLLSQLGNKVKGTYSPGNGTISGTISSNGNLTYTWIQNGGKEGLGSGTFQPSRDSASFQGWFNRKIGNPEMAMGSWTGRKISSMVSSAPTVQTLPMTINQNYAGTWNLLSSSGNRFVMQLSQSGNQVSGTYSPRNGRIDGQIGGDGRLVYRWAEDGAKGTGAFTMTPAGTAVDGTFGYGDNPNDVSGTWGGTRLKWY